MDYPQWIKTALSSSHAVAWGHEIENTLVWDRRNGELVRIFPGSCSEGPVILKDNLVVHGSRWDEPASVYDLALPRDSPPLRQLAVGNQAAHLEANTLAYVQYPSLNELYEVHTVDIITGEEVRPVMYIHTFYCELYDERFFFGMPGLVFSVDANREGFRAMCLNIDSRVVTLVCAQMPEGLHDFFFAPTDKHKRLVCRRGVGENASLAVLTFPSWGSLGSGRFVS